MSEPALQLRGVHADIAQYRILHGVDLDVPRGAVTMLLGRNGVGKTTTLRTVVGHLAAREGAIRLMGADVTRLPTSERARAGIGYVPETMDVFSDLTVEENMILAAIGGPLDPARLEWIFAAFPPLRTFWRGAAGTLSGGQKQMLSIARAVAEERALYLIDEPTKGLAPAIVSTMARALGELKRGGASILMVEQNFAVARALGDHAAVMDDGRVVWTGAMAELAADPALQERLMGLSLETAP
ncbi:ABC transporter ATP-binding protein [Jannaschia sp. W003]|uniref:ABC transporter ATP-binding protein n=1 Tax=Jannaschia sp. W003 TaxID=2867012 RepID=UPI0021A30BFD|nr:ABC transporter ATP-binding protein [Jannaschia sp. W003]UWQ21950.1 ABC transporter ATP-binding protein [Jannaschia sp. W003]